jgi:serine/threonine protein kinase
MTDAETLVAGRYRVIRTLGAGGMGRVWLARDEVLCRDVAIKEIVLPFGLPDDEREEMRLRTLREARAAARLSHPNVVQIYDVQSGNEQPWIVMEYVRSRSLLQVISENGPLPVEQVAGIGLAVLSALDAANRVGVLHRDVKPSNVLIADDGRVVLTDFGSAMIDEGEGALTRTGVILGSPQYIAPERVDRGVSTAEADLWSLGATLYAAVEGRPPYSRLTTYRSLIALTTDKPDPTRLAGPLRPVLNGLLQRNPQARMKPAEVEQRLRRLADVQTTVHLRHVPEQRQPASLRPTRHELPSGAAVAAQAQSQPPAGDRRRRDVGSPTAVPVMSPRRWRSMAAAGVAAVVLPLIAVAGSVDQSSWPWSAGVRDGAQQGRVLPAVIPTRQPSGSPSETGSPSPTATRFVLPARFLWWRDRTGYQVAFPTNWSHLREGREAMFFCAPGGPPTLRVRVWDNAGTDLTAALAKQEQKADLPAYRRIRIEPRGAEAVWEYTFTDPKAGPLRGLERAFVAGGHRYLMQWRTPPAKWAANAQRFAVVTNSFRPPAGT